MSEEHIKSSSIAIVLVVIGLFALTVHTGAFLLFRILNKNHSQPTETRLRKPEGPLLEEAEAKTLDALREQEHVTLNSYAWVDRSKGIVRIPVAKEMQIMLSENKENYED